MPLFILECLISKTLLVIAAEGYWEEAQITMTVRHIKAREQNCAFAVSFFQMRVKRNSYSQITGDDCNKRKKHDEWGYASMFLHHISDLEMLVSKSGRQPFAQEAPRVPQVSHKGPEFRSQNCSHTIPK